MDGPGEAAEFDAFVAARGPALQRLARALVRDPADAEDVVRDVLAKALLKWRRVRRADDPVVYVNRMLVDESTSSRRWAVSRGHPRAPERGPGGGGADDSREGADRRTLLTAVRALPTEQRAVVALRYLDEMPDERIAEVLRTSVGSVRVNAGRGLSRLRASVVAVATA
ncbi:sigma factor-like helix-turn-helix DNA-binding protein [Kineococcus sp. SYSU DK005]|uniref:sigma factor-like helix-turn-helix DNA-binding protein n=1 Tax=Kineococcus sp. SYSU DK005 TaxID=3383126 RepID=UPI003D7E07D7